MLLKQTLNRLIDICALASKYGRADADIHLYKCDDNRWRTDIIQKDVAETNIKYLRFIFEIEEIPNLDEGVNCIKIPATLCEYMTSTKKKDFDHSMVDTFLQLLTVDIGEVRDSFNKFSSLLYNEIELDRGGYINYQGIDFELSCDPTIFINITYRTPKIDVAKYGVKSGAREIAIAVDEGSGIKSIGTITVL